MPTPGSAPASLLRNRQTLQLPPIDGDKEKSVQTATLMGECDVAILVLYLCSFGPPSLALVAHHLERSGNGKNGN